MSFHRPGLLRHNTAVIRAFLVAYLSLLALLAGLAIWGGLLLLRETGPSDAIEAAADRYAFDLLTWELRHLPRKWLYELGHLRQSRDRAQEEETLRRYFAAAEEIRRLERSGSNPGLLEERKRERAALENEAEDILEARLGSFLKGQGLTISPPLFSRMELLFPPLDFELDSPPGVLVISPRDRIEYDRSYLLTPGLEIHTILDIEEESEAAPVYPGVGASALVVSTSGLATYPSVVSELAPYESLIESVIHEWVHQYLALFPLGRDYFAGSKARTLNETAADLAARDLTRLFLRRYPSPLPTPPASPAADFDFPAEMRALRQRVEELLAQGRIKEAERLMEEKRQEFEGQGVYIRRINQAFFAFHGFYADSPASLDPVGPKLEELLRRTGSPARFLHLVSRITSEAELDRLLASLGG